MVIKREEVIIKQNRRKAINASLNSACLLLVPSTNSTSHLSILTSVTDNFKTLLSDTLFKIFNNLQILFEGNYTKFG